MFLLTFYDYITIEFAAYHLFQKLEMENLLEKET